MKVTYNTQIHLTYLKPDNRIKIFKIIFNITCESYNRVKIFKIIFNTNHYNKEI